jgi:hypothetical protein
MLRLLLVAWQFVPVIGKKLMPWKQGPEVPWQLWACTLSAMDNDDTKTISARMRIRLERRANLKVTTFLPVNSQGGPPNAPLHRSAAWQIYSKQSCCSDTRSRKSGNPQGELFSGDGNKRRKSKTLKAQL